MEPADPGEDCRRDIVLALGKMGFDVEAAHHEVALVSMKLTSSTPML